MTQFETLYNYIPPSILKKEKGFIPADVNPLFMNVFDRIFAYILKKNFATIRVKNLHYYNLRDKNKGNIFYAPHQCWWDGMIGYYLGRKVFKTNMRMMVEDLPSFPVLSKIGAFSVSKNDLSSTIKSLRYVIDYLREDIVLFGFFLRE
jgi:hypothetical protein